MPPNKPAWYAPCVVRATWSTGELPRACRTRHATAGVISGLAVLVGVDCYEHCEQPD
jgi:hypothetical protein